MNLITEVSIDGADGYNFEIDKEVNYLKVYISGEFAAEHADQRFFLQINELSSGYNSFIVMDGHAHLGEWDGRGFYLGRNGWFLDGCMSAEYTIAAKGLDFKRTGHGMSTFVNSNDTILGCHANGFVTSQNQINNVRFFYTGGIFKGHLSYYLM